eukprot:9223635-Lingulodinium_polyedra.AAC.1
MRSSVSHGITKSPVGVSGPQLFAQTRSMTWGNSRASQSTLRPRGGSSSISPSTSRQQHSRLNFSQHAVSSRQ